MVIVYRPKMSVHIYQTQRCQN